MAAMYTKTRQKYGPSLLEVKFPLSSMVSFLSLIFY